MHNQLITKLNNSSRTKLCIHFLSLASTTNPRYTVQDLYDWWWWYTYRFGPQRLLEWTELKVPWSNFEKLFKTNASLQMFVYSFCVILRALCSLTTNLLIQIINLWTEFLDDRLVTRTQITLQCVCLLLYLNAFKNRQYHTMFIHSSCG